MGPPGVSGGNQDARGSDQSHREASMGPPLVNGGNGRPRFRPTASSICFNGAAVSERRKWLEK